MFTPQDFEIIDAHCHPFDFPENNIACYGSPRSMKEFDAEMRRVGIDYYVGCVIRHGEADFARIQELNREALRLRNRYPAYIPGIHLHGGFPQESCQELHDMVNEGVKWIGEILPYMFGAYDSPTGIEILKEAEKLSLPVNFHFGEKEVVENIARQCPDLNIILAHPGDFFDEYGAIARLKLVSEHPNLYMDISGSGLFRWGMLRYAVDTCGADRLLFGTDMPVCSAGMNLYGALSEHLTKDEFKLIFSENFRRLAHFPK